MGKLLLITGDLAAGKSTFANILSKRYNTNVFCKDSMKEMLCDTLGFSNREENKKLSNVTLELMYFLFSEFGKLSKNLILESNFHTTELEQLHQIATRYNYEVLTLVLRGDIEILYQRYMNRMQNENRHPAHLSTTLNIYDDFKECTKYLRNEKIPGETVSINTNDFSYQVDITILTKIDEFMRHQ